jgi:hypothetical protein
LISAGLDQRQDFLDQIGCLAGCTTTSPFRHQARAIRIRAHAGKRDHDRPEHGAEKELAARATDPVNLDHVRPTPRDAWEARRASTRGPWGLAERDSVYCLLNGDR